MPVYKDERTGKWYVKGRYKAWSGETKQVTKRGFALRRDAVAWESSFMAQKKPSLDITFEDFFKIYADDKKKRMKQRTWENMFTDVRRRILPYFGRMKLSEITSVHVIRWQDELMDVKKGNGDPLSKTTLRNTHGKLSSIFAHAVRYYKLPSNPAIEAGPIGSKQCDEMTIWTEAEYSQFIQTVDRPGPHLAFNLLYWCGMRIGEMQALTPADFDLEKGTVSISKTFFRRHKQDYITPPKTKNSYRTITMPSFLCTEVNEYLTHIYSPKNDARIIPIGESTIRKCLNDNGKACGLKHIRIHDLRHSHVSLLIQMGYNAVAIAKRVGHKSIDITFRYAHMFPSVQDDMAKKLNDIQKEEPQSETL